MKILIAIEDLRTGGAQVFGMRLAQALHERGHAVWLYSHYHTYTNHALVRQVAPNVPVLGFDASGVPGLEWLSRKVQGLLYRFGKPFSWREAWVERHLRQTIETLGVQLINTHMIKSDYVATAAGAAARPQVPVVITMHGCYEEFLHKPSQPEVTLKSREALRQAAAVVYLTKKNLEIFTVPGVRAFDDIPHAQIYNGFDGHFSAAGALPTRAQLGIGAQDVVFGMVARGIAEKGWQYALSAFEEVSAGHPNAHLVLVGSSDYLTGLAAAARNPRVHFVGFAANPIDWVRLFDVGLLPSYFASESLPNSIAEYLFCGVPVVATRIGEIPQMLAVPDQGLAGVLLEQNGHGLSNPPALTAALRAYLADPELLATDKAKALLCFEKFKMSRCIAAYEAIFAQALAAA